MNEPKTNAGIAANNATAASGQAANALAPVARLAPAVVSERPRPLIPGDFDTAVRLSKYIAASGLAPRGIQTVEAIFTAIQLGAEVGLTPMASLQNIAVVNGRPTIWGDAQLGLVRASGLLTEFRETYEGTYPNDDYKAVCVAARLGEADLAINEFSIADAKQAGLWNKDGPWKTNPKRMLKMRARAFTLRDKFTDILKGLYATEELQSVTPIQTDDNSSVAALNAEFVDVPHEPAAPAKTQANTETPHDPVTGEVQEDDPLEIPAMLRRPQGQKAATTLGADQEAVAVLYEKLKAMKKTERSSAFLEAGGLALIDKAGRNPTLDKMFSDIGVILP